MKKPTKKPAAKKTTRRAVKTKAPVAKFGKSAWGDGSVYGGKKKPAITDKVQELIDKTASVPIESYIVNAVTKALKKRDDAIMAELAKIEGLVRRVEEIVAVVERSEILLTKMDATVHREIVVKTEDVKVSASISIEPGYSSQDEIDGPCAAEKI